MRARRIALPDGAWASEMPPRGLRPSQSGVPSTSGDNLAALTLSSSGWWPPSEAGCCRSCGWSTRYLRNAILSAISIAVEPSSALKRRKRHEQQHGSVFGVASDAQRRAQTPTSSRLSRLRRTRGRPSRGPRRRAGATPPPSWPAHMTSAIAGVERPRGVGAQDGRVAAADARTRRTAHLGGDLGRDDVQVPPRRVADGPGDLGLQLLAHRLQRPKGPTSLLATTGEGRCRAGPLRDAGAGKQVRAAVRPMARVPCSSRAPASTSWSRRQTWWRCRRALAALSAARRTASPPPAPNSHPPSTLSSSTWGSVGSARGLSEACTAPHTQGKAGVKQGVAHCCGRAAQATRG